MSSYQPFDLDAYRTRIQNGTCFICDIVRGVDTVNNVVYKDESAVVLLDRYPTLYGKTLVAPVEHREQVTGDFSPDEYLALQKVVYRVAEALRQELPTERVYILSLGSQQGNSHVHWHIAPLPPGVPFEEQQFAALMLENKGYLEIRGDEMTAFAKRLAARISELDDRRQATDH